MSFWQDHILSTRHHHQMLRLVEEVHRLYVFVSKNQPKGKISMPKDPLAEITEIKAAFDAQTAKVATLTAALAAAQAANPTSDFITPDVQAALDALDADAVPPAPSTPPASS